MAHYTPADHACCMVFQPGQCKIAHSNKPARFLPRNTENRFARGEISIEEYDETRRIPEENKITK